MLRRRARGCALSWRGLPFRSPPPPRGHTPRGENRVFIEQTWDDRGTFYKKHLDAPVLSRCSLDGGRLFRATVASELWTALLEAEKIKRTRGGFEGRSIFGFAFNGASPWTLYLVRLGFSPVYNGSLPRDTGVYGGVQRGPGRYDERTAGEKICWTELAIELPAFEVAGFVACGHSGNVVS